MYLCMYVHFTPPSPYPAALRVPGVTTAEVSLPMETATVYYDSAIANPEEVRGWNYYHCCLR